MTHDELENGTQCALDFDKLAKVAACGTPVIPVAVQDAHTKDMLIIAYVNEEALAHSIKTGNATFWSTSRNTLWEKGATSGDTLKIQEILVNCEQNSLVFLVEPQGKGSCHTTDSQGRTRPTCYYRRLKDGELSFLNEME